MQIKKSVKIIHSSPKFLVPRGFQFSVEKALSKKKYSNLYFRNLKIRLNVP